MRTSEQLAKLAEAMAQAQKELRPALKDATNPHFKSTYADLGSVLDAAKVYTEHGVVIVQDVQFDEAGVGVSTRLLHTSGEWMEFGPLVVPVGKRDAHGVGSATTYAKRYALQAALGMASEDDDGNAATESPDTKRTTQRKAEAAPKGYADWLLDFEAAADNGIDALTAAFKLAPEAFREHYVATVSQSVREALKAKARNAKPVAA